jgi:hypothetical protein
MRKGRGVRRRPRNRQSGNSLVLALIVLSALGTLSMLTVLSVRGGMQTAASDRFHTIALYAAESGGAIAMDYLRTNVDPVTKWSDYVEPAGTPFELTGLTNPLSADQKSSFEVEIYNNRSDTGYVAGDDTDARVIIRSTGHGPDGATSIIEWEVTIESTTLATPCNVLAQKGQSASNDGGSPCVGAIDTSQSASFTP